MTPLLVIIAKVKQIATFNHHDVQKLHMNNLYKKSQGA